MTGGFDVGFGFLINLALSFSFLFCICICLNFFFGIILYFGGLGFLVTLYFVGLFGGGLLLDLGGADFFFFNNGGGPRFGAGGIASSSRIR